MPNPFSRKVKIPEEPKHVYRVTDTLTWQVDIMRYVYVKHTEKTVSIIDTSRRERKFAWKAKDDCWFFSIDEARKCAADKLNERRKKLDSYLKMIEKSEKKLEAGKVLDMKPMAKIDFDESEYKV